MRKITIAKQISLLLIIVGLNSTSALMAQIPSNGLAAYYSINGNASDLSVNGNDGTVTNAVLIADRNSNNNSAYYFDGDEDYISVPHNSSLNFTSGLTVGVWVKVENTDCQFVTKGDTSCGFSIQYLPGNTLEFRLINNVGGDISTTCTGDILNNWHFIVGTYDGSFAKLYLDGSEVDSQSFTGDIGNTFHLTFGKVISDWANLYFQGSLDDMFLFNRTMTEDEITQIFTGNLDGAWIHTCSPYFICGDVRIDPYNTHIIDPGVSVYFTNQYEMTVNGCLVADGQPGNEILFSATDTIGINLGSDKGWNGIEFLNTNLSSLAISVLDYCIFEYISYIFISKENRGAVYVYNSSKTEFTNCFIQNNFNLNSGGGIYFDHSEGKIENCTIQNNETNGFGGGLLLNNCMTDVTIAGNIITNNAATSEGGGVYVVQGSPILDNLTIAGNHAEYGGGACLVSTGAIIQNSYINGNNQAEQHGGGIFISQGSPTLNNITISGNSAANRGGGVYMYITSAVLNNNSLISSNNAYDGGGIYLYKGSPVFENSSMENNTADNNGGGLYLNNYSSVFSGADIISNQAGNQGGGIYVNGGTPDIRYIIINENNADSQADAIFNNNGTTNVQNITCYNNGDVTTEELVYNGTGTLTIENSILWGNHSTIPISPSSGLTINYSDIEGGFTGTGNINSDPLFTDPSNNDFNLKWPLFPDTLDPGRSPCIDAGNPYNWLTNPDDREPDGSKRDMGAIFFHQDPIVSIWDDDASPNFYDFGVVNVWYDSIKYFQFKNDINAFFECPVYFVEHEYPAAVGFILEFGPVSADSVTYDLSPFQEDNVKIHFIPTITDDARKYLYAGDPTFAPNHDSIYVKGTGKGIGTIQGHITTVNQHIGIENIIVHIENFPTLDTNVYTDVDGYYNANNIGLGIFTVTPSLEVGGYWQDFNPTFTSVTLTETNDMKTQDFDLVSAYNVSGHVYYESTLCPVEGVLITRDSTEIDSADENGSFIFYDVLKGPHEFSAVLEGHVFLVNPISQTILSTTENLDFSDQFTYELTCSILGGCEIVLNPYIEVNINNTDVCDNTVHTLPLIDGIGSINLPPGNYHVENEFFLFNGTGIVAGTFSDDIDLTQADTIAAFILEADRYIYSAWATSDLQYYEDGVILYQDSTYDLKIELYELYGSDSCFLDEGQITLIDNASITQGDTILSINDSTRCVHYQFVAGDPNIVPPYARTLTIQHEYSDTKAVVTEDVTVYILGEKARGEAFATTSPEVPLMILRDPPGDQSFSFFDETLETSLSFSMYTIDAFNTSSTNTISLGYDFLIETGFIVSTTTNIETTLDFSSQFDTK
ncbi:MAG: right-handed parallel beta-helix repeat-containing protein, partial [Bacteroidales bacterium]|nr:right-handed parallel beta-helix repeat-containing protein [Bacteroidales bacterium]